MCFFLYKCVFFGGGLTTYYSHDHNLVLLSEIHNKAAWDSVSDRYQHEIEAKWVSQSKMVAKPERTWHPWSIPAGHPKTHGTEKRHQQYAFCRTQKLCQFTFRILRYIAILGQETTYHQKCLRFRGVAVVFSLTPHQPLISLLKETICITYHFF